MKNNKNTIQQKNLLSIPTFIISVLALCLCIYNLNNKGFQKIACIDTARLLKAYKGSEAFSADYTERVKTNKLKLDTLVAEFQKALQDFEKKRPSLNKEQIEFEKTKLTRLQEQYEQYSSVNQEKLKKEELETIQGIVNAINKKVNQFAVSEGYDIVFGTKPNGELMYSGKYSDITDEVIEIIND